MDNMQGIDLDYKPWGGLAGVMSGERAVQMDQANKQALEQSQLENVIKRVQANRAENDYNNPEMEQWRQKGLIGTGMEQYSKGATANGSLQENIQKAVAEATAGKSKAQLEKEHSDNLAAFGKIQKAVQLFNTPEGQNPAASYAVLQQVAPALGLESNEVQQILQQEQQKPGTIKTMLTQALPAMQYTIEHSAHVLESTATETGKANAQLPAHAMSAAASMYGADQSLKGHLAQVAATKANTVAMQDNKEEAQRQGMMNQVIHLQARTEAEIGGLVKELENITPSNYSGLSGEKGKPLTLAEKQAKALADRRGIQAQIELKKARLASLNKDADSLYDSSRITPVRPTNAPSTTPSLPPGVTIKK